MASLLTPDTWVYVIVVNPGPAETYLGQEDPDTGRQFIPVFVDKPMAEQAAGQLVPQPPPPYDIQAIEMAELTRQMSGTGVTVAAVDARGRISRQIPSDRPE